MKEFIYKEWEEDGEKNFETKKQELESKGFRRTAEMVTHSGEHYLFENENEVVKLTLLLKEVMKEQSINIISILSNYTPEERKEIINEVTEYFDVKVIE